MIFLKKNKSNKNKKQKKIKKNSIKPKLYVNNGFEIKKEENISRKNECVIMTHMGTGDMFTHHELFKKCTELYEKVHIFSLYRNRFMMEQMFEKEDKIVVHIIDNDFNSGQITDEIVDRYIEDRSIYDIIRLGFVNSDKKRLNFRKYRKYFWMIFYEDAGYRYWLRYNEKYNKLNRNLEREKELYDEVVKKYGEKYIFIHDHRNKFYKHYALRDNIIINSKIPIFHPNINYYENDLENKYYNMWDDIFYRENILDYGMIIENAQEIYLTDSSFSCMVPYLNLDKVKKKRIYSIFNYKKYHKCFNNWDTIKRIIKIKIKKKDKIKDEKTKDDIDINNDSNNTKHEKQIIKKNKNKNKNKKKHKIRRFVH